MKSSLFSLVIKNVQKFSIFFLNLDLKFEVIKTLETKNLKFYVSFVHKARELTRFSLRDSEQEIRDFQGKDRGDIKKMWRGHTKFELHKNIVSRSHHSWDR